MKNTAKFPDEIRVFICTPEQDPNEKFPYLRVADDAVESDRVIRQGQKVGVYRLVGVKTQHEKRWIE